MIRSVKISNFRSLGDDVHLRLGNFTVLVGSNGSGKSNVMDALRFVSDAMHMGLQGAVTHRHGIGAVRRWSGGHPFNLAIEVDLALDSGSATYSFELAGARAQEYRVKSEHARIANGKPVEFHVAEGAWLSGPSNLRPPLDAQSLALPLVGGDARFAPLVHELQRLSIYAIYPDTLRTPQKYSPLKPMSRHGDNWISILKDQPEASWKGDLVAGLNRLTGDIEDIKISSAASFLVVQFRHRSPTRAQKWFDATQESDGTLRVAGIISALLQDPPVPVIGIEEPELTVHPGAVPLLHDFLVEASHKSQVIVTTHSPELLELVNPEDVRVVARADGETRISPMAENQKQAVRDRLLTLGDLMRLEGLQQDLPLPEA